MAVGLIARRLLQAAAALLVVLLVVFVCLLTTGDPVEMLAPPEASERDKAMIRQAYGLDRPLLYQYGVFVWRAARGDFGRSFFSDRSALGLVSERLPASLELALASTAIAIVVGVPLGIVAAWKKGSWIDRLVMVVAVSGFSMPVFWLGFVLVYVFAISFAWLPVQGYQPLAAGLWPFLRHLILPAVTLSVIYMALVARMTRASMLGVLGEDYIRTAFAKGLPPGRVLVRHALKNASLPVVTIIGIGFALLIGGAVVTESVFALPGLGRLTVDAIVRRDYPVIQGVLLTVSGVYVLINLVIDMLYVVLDPRIRY